MTTAMNAVVRDGRQLVRNMPCAVTDTMARLEEYGHQAVVVGGAVRSLAQGHQPADWDLATSATPDQVMALFRRVHPTGLKYGTVTVSEGGLLLEVTTFRADGAYGDGRRPDTVQFGHDLTTDLARRDFTVNAMALDVRGVLSDPWGGLDDLEHGLIRAVGDPAARFAEDGLRLLRAVRLAAELGFVLEPATRRAIRERAAWLGKIAAERRLQELRRVLLAKAAGWGLTQLRQGGLWPFIWPGNPLPRAAPDAMAALPFDWELRLAACAVAGRRRVPAAALSGLGQLRLPRRAASRVRAIAAAWPPQWPAGQELLTEAVIGAGRSLTDDLLWLVAAAPPGGAAPAAAAARPGAAAVAAPAVRVLLDSGRPLAVSELAIGGKDLLEAGIAAGPNVGKALQRLLWLAANGLVANKRDVLLQQARKEFAAT